MITVLLIEDYEDIYVLLTEALQEAGYRVVRSEGPDALAVAHAQRPDLVLLDLHLVTIDGQDVYRSLKRDARTRQLPIVIMSALADAVDIASNLGATALLEKPFTLKALHATLQRVLATDATHMHAPH